MRRRRRQRPDAPWRTRIPEVACWFALPTSQRWFPVAKKPNSPPSQAMGEGILEHLRDAWEKYCGDGRDGFRKLKLA